MRLILSLSVLLVVLSVVLEGPAPAQAAPDFSDTMGNIPGIPGKLKELGSKVEEKARTTYDRIKNSELPSKARDWFVGVFNKVKEQIKTTFS